VCRAPPAPRAPAGAELQCCTVCASDPRAISASASMPADAVLSVFRGGRFRPSRVWLLQTLLLRMATMYEVQVPEDVMPGMAFQANVGGQLMMITCPEGCGPGQLIQVAGPSVAMPTVTGVPMGDVPLGSSYPTGVAAGVAIGPEYGGMPMNMHMRPEVGYVEVDEISPAGWMCLIVGCFACPGLNLLGLCMRERRLVPVNHIY